MISLFELKLRESIPINLNDSLPLYVILLGFTTLFITFNNNKKIIVILYTLLGTISLIALTLFILSGASSFLGIYGTILLVTIIHMILIPRLNNGFKIIKKIIIKKFLSYLIISSSDNSCKKIKRRQKQKNRYY
jgi:hypothetical protein